MLDPTAMVDDPSFRQSVQSVVDRLRTLPGVESVTSFYDGPPSLASTDRHATYVAIQLKALDDSGKRIDY